MADTCAVCGSSKNFAEFLASLIKIDADGNYGVNLHAIYVKDCNDLTSAVACGTAYNLEELILKACNIDDCGNARLNVFADTRAEQ